MLTINRIYFKSLSPIKITEIEVSLDGQTSSDRVASYGYVGQNIVENIAAGQELARNTFEQWRNSATHCQQMLDRNVNELGVGFVHDPTSQFQFYWVQTFARR